jgi:hypothetical protein
MLRRIALGALALLFATAPAWAQAPAPERRTLAVSVLDKDGKAVHGLTAENFRGECRGQPVRILSAAEDSSPAASPSSLIAAGAWGLTFKRC